MTGPSARAAAPSPTHQGLYAVKTEPASSRLPRKTSDAPRAARGRTSRSNGAATRERILQVATSLFASGGYEATSLRQISAAAEVDLATLKYHFGDKPALFAEVYRQGHMAFLDFIEPILVDLARATSREGLDLLLDRLVTGTHDFIEGHLPFVRLVLYRILEDPSEITGQEEELQGVAIALLDRSFQGAVARGLIRPIDTRALIGLLLTAIPMWLVGGRVRGDWFGPPALGSEEGRGRSEAFLRDLLGRVLLA